MIGVVDTDNDQKHVTYPIIANTKSLRFYHTFAHLLVSTCPPRFHALLQPQLARVLRSVYGAV